MSGALPLLPMPQGAGADGHSAAQHALADGYIYAINVDQLNTAASNAQVCSSDAATLSVVARAASRCGCWSAKRSGSRTPTTCCGGLWAQGGGGNDNEITVVTDHDPVLPDVSLEIDLDRDIQLTDDEPIGTGAFGAVFSGVYRGHMVAVKVRGVACGEAQRVPDRSLTRDVRACRLCAVCDQERGGGRRAQRGRRDAAAGGPHPVARAAPQRGQVLGREPQSARLHRRGTAAGGKTRASAARPARCGPVVGAFNAARLTLVPARRATSPSWCTRTTSCL